MVNAPEAFSMGSPRKFSYGAEAVVRTKALPKCCNRFVLRALLFAAAWLLMMVPAKSADPARGQEILLSVQQLDAKILRIGHRLATAGVGLCRDREPVAGISIHYLSQYAEPFRTAAQRLFKLNGANPAVLAVAPSSPADQAGLESGDTIIAIDGEAPPPDLIEAEDGFAATEAGIERIEAALADGEAKLTLRRGTEEVEARVRGEPGCRTRFQLVPDDRPSAAADGRWVQISSALARFTQSEDELAAILAHELAHNILRHRERLNEAGVSRGLFKGFGRSARLTKATEMEADRLSVYLLDRAGYSVERALDLWPRFERAHGHGIFTAATHLRPRERLRLFREEAARLAEMKARGEEPIPPILRGPLPALR
jgi:beta-barrel assembly-enhancing protease